MEVKINIAAILKDKPQNTRLWSPIFGDVYLKDVTDFNNNTIRIAHHGVDNIFLSNGKVWADGDVCLFPSRWMNDWQKFAWKKGDVLVSNDGKQECIFDGWYNKDYTQARVKYWLDTSNENNIKCLEENQPLTSVMFKQEDKEKIENYINTIEEWYGGKLNLETLEIEKLAFEIGKLYVFNEQDEDGELTIIGNLIGRNENYDTLTFGNQYEIENEKFVTDNDFDLRISVHEELREATESETTVFQKAYTQWLEKDKKAMRAKEQPAFKPFDKVLVRNGDNNKWQPAFFVRDHGESLVLRYEVLLINSGKSDSFASCIPFEGNEDIAFTDHDEYLSF